MYNFGVFIGRFQPPHLGHIHNINVALQQYDFRLGQAGSSGFWEIAQPPSRHGMGGYSRPRSQSLNGDILGIDDTPGDPAAL